jgi:hypothetical protein
LVRASPTVRIRQGNAREICAAAVAGHISNETSRIAFVEALTDVNMAVVAPD